MQSLMVIFIFSFFDWNLSPWPNLASILIRISISSGINFLCFRLEMPFSGKFFTKKKIKIVSFSWNLVLNKFQYAEINGDIYFIYFRLKISFLGKFCPKNYNCQLKLKSGAEADSNANNSIMMFIFLCFGLEVSFFREYLFKKIKIACLS